MYSFELQCVQTMKDEVPCIVAYGKTNKVISAFNIHKLEVSLYNLQITFKNKLSFIIPLDRIKSALNKNEIKLKSIDTKKAMMDNLKFIRYKGNYFKKYVVDNDIHTWVPQYCMLCGEPITFTFKEDVIEISGSCKCGNLTYSINKMNYDEFAIWYASQTDNLIKSYYDKFWFKKE